MSAGEAAATYAPRKANKEDQLESSVREGKVLQIPLAQVVDRRARK
jgi:hypothetical protein